MNYCVSYENIAIASFCNLGKKITNEYVTTQKEYQDLVLLPQRHTRVNT